MEGKEFREGDWYCRDCKEHNYSRRINCFSCKGPRDINQGGGGGGGGGGNGGRQRDQHGVARKGDFYCSKCGELNFAFRERCHKCNKRKDNDLKQAGAQEQFKLGDWFCTLCNFMNYASRDKCKNCDASRDSSISTRPGGRPRGHASQRNYRDDDRSYSDERDHRRRSYRDDEDSFSEEDQHQDSESRARGSDRNPSDMLPGDWMCYQCHAHNFARRSECYKCGHRINRRDDNFGRPPPQRDEINCPNCRTDNRSSRMDCRRCGAILKSNRDRSRSRSMSHREGDWMCRNCNFHNFARRVSCKKCGQQC